MATSLLEKFRITAAERARAVEGALVALVSRRGDGSELATVRRQLHTLKGESKLLGFEAIFLVVSRMEQLVDTVRWDGRQGDDGVVDLLAGGLRLVDDIRGLDPGDAQAAERVAPFCREVDALLSRSSDWTRLSEHGEATPRESVSPQAGDRRWKVLLIDDSEIALEVAKSVLQASGFEVRATTALDRFDELLVDWSPEVVLTDVNMPGMTGVELCSALKRRYETAHVPILLCSSLPPRELAELARKCDADGYVSKSERLETLAEELRALCETIVW